MKIKWLSLMGLIFSLIIYFTNSAIREDILITIYFIVIIFIFAVNSIEQEKGDLKEE